MTYLRLFKNGVEQVAQRPYIADSTDIHRYHYPLNGDGQTLVTGWCLTAYSVDSTISGVLADWLEENRSDLLVGATGPSDPAVRLDQLIDYLRNRYLVGV